jgi:hypothetical protein
VTMLTVSDQHPSAASRGARAIRRCRCTTYEQN